MLPVNKGLDRSTVTAEEDLFPCCRGYVAYYDACNDFLLFNCEHKFCLPDRIRALEELVDLNCAIISDHDQME